MGDLLERFVGRGSEWHRWDPHIHAPGTVKADHFGKDSCEQYLQALESTSPAIKAIGITDYGVTASYERLRAEKDKGRLPECDLLFPNIELRLDLGTVKGNFVNIHLLVSPEDPNHVDELNRFLGRLQFTAANDTFVCTPPDLMRLGRKTDPSKTDNAAALEHGYTQFKVNLDQMLNVYRDIEWARQNILIAVAGAADGTSGLREAAEAAIRQKIERAAHVIFSSNVKDREFWLGRGSASPEEIRDLYAALKPCLWGCDAHELAKVGKPDLDRLCWVKGKPTFDALRQAYIDPERAYVGKEPPTGASPSQVVNDVKVSGASWARTPQLELNPGLVAVVGARGSGKTALADMIAAGCDAYTGSQARPSFLARANEYLAGATVTVTWQDGEHVFTRPLDSPVNWSADAYPRARYLSQQFVEELCSIEGMPKLIKEIERVIFEAHPSIDRDGAVDFDGLLELRAREFSDARAREEAALANVSDLIGIEMEKTKQVSPLREQISAKEKLIAGYQRDRQSLMPKVPSKASERLQALNDALETVRSYIRFYANQYAALTDVRGDVKDLRQNRAPEALRQMKDRHKLSGFEATEWDQFLLTFSGEVDNTVAAKVADVDREGRKWKGETPTKAIDESGAFIAETADLKRTPLAVLEAEVKRLGGVLLQDQEIAKKLVAVNKRIGDETAALEKLKETLADCEAAASRASALVVDREAGYVRVFDAVLGLEKVLSDLYKPLMDRLGTTGGTLAKLSFTVSRVADVKRWAERGEQDLFDLRGGPFKGIGSLARLASTTLQPAWEKGDSAGASAAMKAFRDQHQDALIDKAPFARTDQVNYRPWSRRFAQWLYSTDHISIEYGIKYDGIDIQKLSPGTRGIVLVLLYLALDDADDRPLIIDQPEENLDPKSIYDELVPLFQAAKRKRQVIMVTHNANLVVNTDADQIIVAEVGAHTSEGLPPITYRSGGLDESDIRRLVCDILEGGEPAFKDRARRLRIALDR